MSHRRAGKTSNNSQKSVTVRIRYSSKTVSEDRDLGHTDVLDERSLVAYREGFQDYQLLDVHWV